MWAKSITVGDAVLLFSFLFFDPSAALIAGRVLVDTFSAARTCCATTAHSRYHPFMSTNTTAQNDVILLRTGFKRKLFVRCSLTMKGRNTPTSFLHRRKCNDPPFTDRPGCRTCIFLNSYRIGPPTQRSIPPFISNQISSPISYATLCCVTR